MITQVHDDILAFSYGEGDLANAPAGSKDGAIFKYQKHYLEGKDSDTAALRRSYFAVMLHGWVNSTAPSASNNNQPAIHWDAGRLAMEILMYHKQIRNRPILLLSCYTGYGIAHPLAVHHLRRPVIAPRSTAIVDTNCKIYVKEDSFEDRNYVNKQFQGYYVQNKPDWVFCSPNGNVTIFPHAELDKQKAVQMARNYL